MRTRTGWLALLLSAGIALVPSRAQAQGVPPADPAFPLPLYHDRPEKGGFFAAGEFLFFRTTNPIKEQLIAVRGFNDVDGTIQLATSLLTGSPTLDQIQPGRFIGSGTPALNAEQVSGPISYQPGWRFTAGWRFGDGSSIEFRWAHLADAKYNAVASILPQPVRGNYPVGTNLADTYLFSPVYNFPNEFAGPPSKISLSTALSTSSAAAAGTVIIGPGGSVQPVPGTGTGGGIFGPISFIGTAAASAAGAIIPPQSAYGIWNGASIMSLSFVQRHDQYDLVGRWPIFQTDCSRWYWTGGGRHVQFWERFMWRTVSLNTDFPSPTATGSVTFNGFTVGVNTVTGPAFTVTAAAGTSPTAVGGVAGADDVAVYTNIVSNRMWGPTIGIGSEWYLGCGFSTSLDLRVSALLDIVKERAKYEREDGYIANKRGRTEYAIVPEASAQANLWWYPIEGVELRVGYEMMNFFNTIAAPRPVDFNYGALAAPWEKGKYRAVEGVNAGIAFIF